MELSAKSLIKKTLLSMGITVRRYSIFADHFALLIRYLDRCGVDLLVDVGANDGEFAKTVRAAGYRGKIISLEPIEEVYRSLVLSAAKDPLWETEHCAIGDQEGESVLNIAGNTASSSLRDMLRAHTEAAPHAAFVSREIVPVRRLDSFLDDRFSIAERIFVKSDTQGFERQVIDGACGALHRIIGFQVEMSTVPLYAGECLMGDLISELRRLGYALVHVEPSFRDPATGNLLQVDGIFIRSAR